MNHIHHTKLLRVRSALSVLAITLALGAAPIVAQAAVTCTQLPPGLDGVPGSGDFDNDGFTDLQECGTGIPLDLGITTTPTVVVTDPNRADVFVIFNRPATGSLLPSDFRPFDPTPVTYNGVTFTGLSALNVNVHQLSADQAGSDRRISSLSAQKAVRITENLDTNGSVLGQCNWGTPMGLDGCMVFTKRVKNYIDATCDSVRDTTTDRNQVFLAYITQTFLHEAGHSLGGLAADYNSRFGGYHYKVGAGVVMEQSVTYSTKGGKCTFFISPGWNVTLDTPAVKLK